MHTQDIVIGVFVGCLCVCGHKNEQFERFMSSTYCVRLRNLASTCLTNESVVQGAKKSRLFKFSALLKLLFNIGDLYQKNDYYHSTSKSRRSQFGLTYGFAC